MNQLCQQCGTRQAALKRGTEIVCTDCYNEPPLIKPGQWDRIINPAYILALEARIEALEKIIKEWIGGK